MEHATRLNGTPLLGGATRPSSMAGTTNVDNRDPAERAATVEYYAIRHRLGLPVTADIELFENPPKEAKHWSIG